MLLVIIFFVTQVVLGFTIWAALRLAQHEGDLDNRFDAIAEVTHRPTRLIAARKELAWARSEAHGVGEQIVRARQRLSELIPLPESSSSVMWFIALTGILYEGESGVALLLNLAANFAGMSAAVAAFVSPIVAAALFAALHVILGALIQIGAAYRPQRVLHRAKLGAVAGGVAVIAAAWAVLSGRSFSDPVMIEAVASWGLLVSALLLSVAGAFASLVVTTLLDERAVERRVARLEKRRTALDRHVESVQRETDQHEARPASISPLSAIGSAAVAALLVVLPAKPMAAQETARGVTHAVGVAAAAPRVDSQLDVNPHSCELLLDVSASVEPSARVQALEGIATDLDVLVSAFDCHVLRFSAFSGEPPFNILRETPPVPEMPTAQSCAGVAPAERKTALAGAIEHLYPNVGKARQDKAADDCLASEQRRRDRQSQVRRDALDAARVMWREVARTPSKGSCSAVDYAAQRALVRSQHVLVLSDGANTCAIPRIDPCIRLGDDQTLAFLMLPGVEPNAPSLAARNASRLESRYPSAHVLFFGELTPSRWRALNSERQAKCVNG